MTACVAAATSRHAPILALAVDQVRPRTLYVGFDQFGTFRSVDGGMTWAVRRRGLPAAFGCGASAIPEISEVTLPSAAFAVTSLAVDPQQSGTVYVGTTCGVFRTADHGAHWERVGQPQVPGSGQGVPGCIDVTALAIDPVQSRTLYAAASSERLYRSVDRGCTWTQLGGVNVSVVAVDPTTHLTVYAAGRNGAARSVDGGEHWAVSGPLPVAVGAITAIVVGRDGAVVLGAHQAGGGLGGAGPGVFRSVDAGRTWIDLNAGSMNILTLAVDAAGTLFAGTDGGGVFRRDDSADTWRPASRGLTGKVGDGTRCESGSTRCVVVNAMVAHPRKPGRLWVGTDFGGDYHIPGRVFVTRNRGRTWMRASDGLP